MTALNSPSAVRLFSALDATWPAHTYRTDDPWVLRLGAGGGQRVSAATIADPGTMVSGQAIDRAESKMFAMGQVPLFMIRAGEERLDRLLAARGYDIIDPVAIYASDAGNLAQDDPGEMMTIRCDTPLAIMEEIWTEGGIDQGRRAVMERVQRPKTYLLGRAGDEVAGVVFVACDGELAMLHALEVSQDHRRKGIGRQLSAAAAAWAAEKGAQILALLAVRENAAAVGLYQGMGMAEVAHYHYRKKQAE